VRIGLGVYAKTSIDAESGAVVPAQRLDVLANETFRKLGIPVQVDPVPRPREDAPDLVSSLQVKRPRGRRIARKLSAFGLSLSYVGESGGRRKRAVTEGGRNASACLAIPSSGVGRYVVELAKRFNVQYTKTYGDQWAESVTRLAGDEVSSSHVKDLLVALKRAGKVSSGEMAALLMNYLREGKQDRAECHV
jgi:hypothetical protein